MCGSCVGFGQEVGLHVVEGLDVGLGLKLAANLANEDGEQVATVSLGVQVAE